MAYPPKGWWWLQISHNVPTVVVTPRSGAIVWSTVRCLVTGGAGFIGSNLVDVLIEHGHSVEVFDNLSTGSRDNLSHLDPGLLTVGSILDPVAIDAAVSRSDLVFHLAAAVGVKYIIDDPLGSIRTNVRGTEEVLDACLRHGAKVVLASTSEIYGRPTKFPISENDDRLLGPTTVSRWSYATSKGIDEHMALAMVPAGLRCSIVRYFNSYGPRLAANGYGSVVATFIGQAMTGAPLTVLGDGSQQRCFTYVGDTALGTYLAGVVDAGQGEPFNIGSQNEIDMATLARTVVDVTGSTSEIRFVSHAEKFGQGFEDPNRRVPDVTKAAQLLGFEAQVTLDQGIRRVIDWWRATRG